MDRSGNKINLPVQLLRTLVAVADLGTFTKAAQALKVTQPVISTRVKRLQQLVGAELLATIEWAPAPEREGEIVVGYARQILTLNDQVVTLGEGGEISSLRVGLADGALPDLVRRMPFHSEGRPRPILLRPLG